MRAGVYLGRAALQRLDDAQSDLDNHLASGHDGRCLACGEDEPCGRRLRAMRVFVRYGQLPKRQPGVTRRQVGRLRAADQAPFDFFRRTPAG